MYFKKEIVPKKVIEQILQVNRITLDEFDRIALEYERMALGLIENKIRSNKELEYSDGLKSDMVMNYVIAKMLQGTALDDIAVGRFENFYTTLNNIFDAEEEYYIQTAPGMMVF